MTAAVDYVNGQGGRGERFVARYLRSLGLWVESTYDNTRRGAPMLRTATAALVLPDLKVCTPSGPPRLVEVKTLARSPLNREIGCKVHAVQGRHWRDYTAVAALFRMPLHVLVLELSTGALLVADEATPSFGCMCRGCERDGHCYAKIRQGHYWRRLDMAVQHTFPLADLADVRVDRKSDEPFSEAAHG